METGDVRLVFRNLAFLGDESHWAAVAASLAADQNMFWPFHDYLFANFQGNESGGFHIDRLLEMGEAVGLDMDAVPRGPDARQRPRALRRDRGRRARRGLRPGHQRHPHRDRRTVCPCESPDFETIADAIDIELAKAATATTDDAETGAEESDEG